MEQRKKEHQEHMVKEHKQQDQSLKDKKEFEEFKEFKRLKQQLHHRNLQDNHDIFEEFMQEKNKKRRLEDTLSYYDSLDYYQPEDEDIQNPRPPRMPSTDPEERKKRFEELKEHWKNTDRRGIESNREEKVKQVQEMFEVILWGDSHPFYSHWIKQVSELAPDGTLVSPWLKRETKHVGIKVEQLEEKGIDLQKESLYTGHIKYEETHAELNIHLRDKYEPYIACRPLQIKGENQNKKIEL